MTEYKFINGPVNIVKLEGYINNIKKTICIFMDVHFDLNNQTKCDSYDSIDIAQYLYKKIKNSKKELDFFLEITRYELEKESRNKRDIYIKEVVGLFKSEFIEKDNKVLYSKTNSKVRLHYVDIRDYLGILKIRQIIELVIYKILEDIKINKNNQIIEELINKTNLIKKYYKYLLDLLETNNFNKNIKSEYFINKVKNIYKNQQLKSKVNSFLDLNIIFSINSIKINLDRLDTTLIFIKKYIKTISQEELQKLNLKSIYEDINANFLRLNTLVTDMYFLRRFLDKDYVKNAITYTGLSHSVNYIEFLIKEYNFKIINSYYTKTNNLDKLTNEIKNSNYYNIHNFFYKTEPIQCIKLDAIPWDLTN